MKTNKIRVLKVPAFILLLICLFIGCDDTSSKWDALSRDIELKPGESKLTLGEIRSVLKQQGKVRQDPGTTNLVWVYFPSGQLAGDEDSEFALSAVRLGFYFKTPIGLSDADKPQIAGIQSPFKGSIHGFHIGDSHEDVIQLARANLPSQQHYEIKYEGKDGSSPWWNHDKTAYTGYTIHWQESEGKVTYVEMEYWDPNWQFKQVDK